MKCPKCEKDWNELLASGEYRTRSEHIQDCHGTGEVEMIHDPAIVMERNASAGEVPDVRFSRTSEPLSNSEQLAKPEMPERIWAHLEDVSFQGSDWIEGWSEEPCVINGENAPYLVQHKYLRSDLHEREIDNLKMLLEESKRQIATLQERDRQNTEMVASMTNQLDKSVEREKVKEADNG